jgi:hypothetical protein
MPLSNGLRFRRKFSSSRRVSSRRIGLSGLAQLLPRALILPIILFAGVTATAAAFWTYDIHVEQAAAEIDEGETTGTVDSAN